MTDAEKADVGSFTAAGRRRVAEATQSSVAQVLDAPAIVFLLRWRSSCKVILRSTKRSTRLRLK